MPANETIDNFIDIAAITAQQQAFLAKILELEAALNRVSSKRLSLNASIKTGDAITGTKEATAAMVGLQKATNDTVGSVNNLRSAQDALKLKNLELSAQLKQGLIDSREKVAADKEAAAAAKLAAKEAQEAGSERLRQLKAEQVEQEKLAAAEKDRQRAEDAQFTGGGNTRAQIVKTPSGSSVQDAFSAANRLEEQIVFLNKNKAALAQVEFELGQYRAALSEGKITQAEFDKELVRSTILQNEYRASIKGNTREIALIERETNAVKGSLEQRRAALIRLNSEYDNLSPQERSTAAGQRLQKITSGLTTQVKELEAATGRAQRNVGNYPGALGKAEGATKKFTGALKGAYTGLSKLAQLIPGLGIGGLILLILDPLASLATSLVKSGEKVDELKEKTKALSEVNLAAGDAFAETSTKLKSFTDRIADKNRSDAETKRLISEVNEEYGKFGINLKNVNDLEEFATKQAVVISQVFLLKAQAAGAYALALENAKKALSDQNGELDDVSSLGDKLSNGIKAASTNLLSFANALRPGGGQGFTFLNAFYKGLDKDRNKNVEKEKAAADRYLKINEDLQKKISEVLKAAGLFDPELDAQRKKEAAAAKAAKDAADAREKADLESLKKRLEREAKEAKEIFEIDLLNIDQRIEARKIQSDKELAIAEVQSRLELKNKNLTAAQEADIAQELSDKVFQIEQKEANDIFLLRVKANQSELEFQKKTNEEFAQLLKDRAKFAEDAIKSELDTRLNNLTFNREAIIKSLEIEKNAKLRAANGEKERQQIEQKYQQQRLQVEIDTDKLILQATIETQEKILATISDDKTKLALQAKIIELKRQLAELDGKAVKLEIDVDNDSIDKTINALQKVKDTALQVFDLIGGAVAASITAQKNALQDKSDQLEKDSQKEIEAINASGDTEEKKAAKIITVNARVAAQKEQIAQKQRQLDQRNAELQKAQGIAQIILNTAIAVSKQIAATPLPLGLPLVLAVGALGAAQLAIAIATPIPKFKTGTKDAPGGAAILGDGFRQEVVQEPSGDLWVTASKPTVYDLPKHSIVYPSVQDAMTATNSMAMRSLRLQAPAQQKSREMDQVVSQLKSVERAIKSQPRTKIVKKFGGWNTEYESAYKQWNYINRVH